MSRDKRLRTKGRRNGHPFLALPHPVLYSDAYVSISDSASRLLSELALQYRGKNNGDLVATMSVLKARGWNSNGKITRALNELLDRGLIVHTRQGRRPRIASLYAITWQPIDECGGKLEVPSTREAPNNWKQFRFSDHPQKVQSEPSKGAMGMGNVVQLNLQKVQ